MPNHDAAPLRLFVALWPDRAVRHALAACRDAIHRPAAARPTATEKLHLTLHFLGAVPPAAVSALEAALSTVASPAFELRLDVMKAWPGGLVVLQASETPPALAHLHAAIGVVLRDLGLPVEKRAFKPHVTLARHAVGAKALAAQAAQAAPTLPLRWPVTGHALVQSTPDGRYQVLRRYGG
ncbi:MAG: RNA 2',3'-cyclic phosphodiesterase [Betaproteobacteria bacterium]|jgi:2'-5' RNA ligase|nr:RNA 2',3'-cyclic phosphodiesterase [Betaproteobacteria bacterium]